MSAPILYLVIPFYNEEEVLPLTIQTLSVKMKQLIARQRIAENSRILFVNDGSKDKTWQLIREAHEQESLCAGLDLRLRPDAQPRTPERAAGRADERHALCGYYRFHGCGPSR